MISIILATSGFLAVSTTQPTSNVSVTAEQAVNILKASDRADRRIVCGSQPVKTDLDYIAINWANYLRNTGPEHHDRIYVSTSPVGEIKPYWIIEYETELSPLPGDYVGSGKYLIDAETGELMMSLESFGGGVTAKGPDYWMSTSQNIGIWYQSALTIPMNFTDHALRVELGEFTPLILTLTAPPYYDASIPISLKVVSVSPDYLVDQNVTSATLRTGGSVSFLLQIFTPVGYAHRPPPSSLPPHFDVEVNFIGSTTSFSIFLVQVNENIS